MSWDLTREILTKRLLSHASDLAGAQQWLDRINTDVEKLLATCIAIDIVAENVDPQLFAKVIDQLTLIN